MDQTLKILRVFLFIEDQNPDIYSKTLKELEFTCLPIRGDEMCLDAQCHGLTVGISFGAEVLPTCCDCRCCKCAIASWKNLELFE